MDEKKELPSTEKTSAPCDTDGDLTAARQAQGLSLSDIFQATRVSMINLQALESGDFKALPPPVYTRNFICKYARAVGVDEKPLLKRYEAYLERQNPPREEPGVQKPWPEASRRYRFLFGSLSVVIVAGILVYAFILYDQSDRTISPAQPSGSPPAERVIPEPAVPIEPVDPAKPTAAAPDPARDKGTTPPTATATTPGSAPVAAKPAIPPPVAESGETLRLVIEAQELTWLRITEGRNPSYQVLLKPGERVERTAADFFLLDIGNAGGVSLTFQGKPLGSLGKQGQVIHLRLPE